MSRNDFERRTYRRRSSALTSAKQKRECRKVIVLGSSGCGKTAFLRRILNDSFTDEHEATVEDFHTIDRVYKGYMLRMEVIDMCGSYVFPVMRDFNIKQAHAVLLLYEIGNEASMQEAADMLLRIKETHEGSLPVVLIGTKLDVHIRGVGGGKNVYELINKWFRTIHNMESDHMLTSAKNDINVERAFNMAMEYIRRSDTWKEVINTSERKFKFRRWLKNSLF